MVAIGISEFTFGFAFLSELTRTHWDDITAAPILPSLQQEQNEGWDAHLPISGIPFFYQFKLTEYLSRSNATHIRNGIYDGPYLRIALHDRDNNRQHRLLWELGQHEPETFYVAPEMITRDSFNDAYLQQSIIPNSRMIRLSDTIQLSDTDSEQHVITFRPNHPDWIFHSEPSRREESFSGREIHRTYESSRPRWRPIDDAFARDLLDSIVAEVRKVEEREGQRTIVDQRNLMELPNAGLPAPAVLRRISDITATVFGATMVLVGMPRT